MANIIKFGGGSSEKREYILKKGVWQNGHGVQVATGSIEIQQRDGCVYFYFAAGSTVNAVRGTKDIVVNEGDMFVMEIKDCESSNSGRLCFGYCKSNNYVDNSSNGLHACNAYWEISPTNCPKVMRTTVLKMVNGNEFRFGIGYYNQFKINVTDIYVVRAKN